MQDFSNGRILVLGVVSYFAPRTVCLILVTNDKTKVSYSNYWYSVLILQLYGTITPDIQVLSQ